MSRVVTGARVPIRIWARHIDDDALAQLHLLAGKPWVEEAVCAMPDVHVAHGVAVGTVFATRDVVVPSALGGDLGCGVVAARVEGGALGLARPTLEAIVTRLARVVPVGDAIHRRGDLPAELRDCPLSTRALGKTRDAIGGRHLGTLGGGNHFLELDRDVDGDLWVLVHTGSRGLGGAIGDHHRRVAADALGPLRCAGGDHGDHGDHEPGDAYLADLSFALSFAAENRRRILERALEVVAEATQREPEEERIDVHHNHVAWEDGRLVHRKGAIAASAGAKAIIPGSMGTASYVVEGRGERSSFASASHGAGRRMSRSEARRTLSLPAVERSLRRVVHRVEGRLVEEAPAAYRDVVEVLEDEADLVTPLLRIEPLAVLKG
jgi:tRNA-splicing ligase RtcB (3'-phosphate/5'-hydroxy nucleic acid ligase)